MGLNVQSFNNYPAMLLKLFFIFTMTSCKITLARKAASINFYPDFPGYTGLRQLVSQATFTLYRVGFCSIPEVAPVQCEQEIMLCCGAEIVLKRSQCEQKPYPSYYLQRFLLI